MRSYLTIKQAGNFEIDIKKSQFICNIARTETKEEAEEFITQIKKEHSSATHNCYAYVLGMDNEVMKQNDNGEPSGTAGEPILNAIQKNNLNNVLIIVTRYFGGILLGAGGLIRAYSNSAIDAINSAGKIIKQPGMEVQVNINYQDNEMFKYYCEKII